MPEPLHYTDDFLIRYLDGELSSDEKTLLEQQLQNDSSLQQRLSNLRLAITAVQQYGTSHKLTSIHKEMMQELKPATGKSKVIAMKTAVRYTMAIAATLLIVMVGIAVFHSQSINSNQLYNEAFVDYNAAAERGTQHSTTIQEAYQQGNYETIVSQAKNTGLTQQDSLLVGLSYLKTNRLTSAIEWLSAISTQNAYRPDADFYLSLAYLKNKNYDKALQLVQSIHSNPNHLYHEQFSEAFIQKLEKLNTKK